jgi:uncharacterized phage protein (TIGR02220 family)
MGGRRVSESISFRWGIPELDHGNVLIPEPILRYHSRVGVVGNLFVLMVHLASFRYESARGAARPSYQTLADRMGLSRRRVMELVEQLESAGFLIVTRNATYCNEFSFAPFAEACWERYKADTSAEDRTSEAGATSAENRTSTSAENRTRLVRNSAPEEQEEKNKNPKNKTSLSSTPVEDPQPSQEPSPADGSQEEPQGPEAVAPAEASAGETEAMFAAIRTLKHLNSVRKSLNARARGFAPSKPNLKPILARLRDGAKVEEGLLIIEHKGAQWGNDPRMREYLRPETLFAPSHYDGYLNAALEWDAAGRPKLSVGGNGGSKQLARGRTAGEYQHLVEGAEEVSA